MSIKVICDKCGHQETMRVLENVHPQNMHSVSPGNSRENDRTLCDICYKKYKQIEAESPEEITRKLLDWIDYGKLDSKTSLGNKH